VPFTVQIPAGERDPELAAKLWEERAAILRWCIDGCLKWQQEGLAPPACVRDATDEYFRSQDTIGEWLEDCTGDADGRAFLHRAGLTAVGVLALPTPASAASDVTLRVTTSRGAWPR
jgi:phage/plasmid-associated DNA primase